MPRLSAGVRSGAQYPGQAWHSDTVCRQRPGARQTAGKAAGGRGRPEGQGPSQGGQAGRGVGCRGRAF